MFSTRSILGVAFLCLSVPATARASDSCSSLMDWNQFALQATVNAGQGALPQIRSLAIVHSAVHDAVNAIEHRYETYLPAQPGAKPGDTLVAEMKFVRVPKGTFWRGGGSYYDEANRQWKRRPRG